MTDGNKAEYVELRLQWQLHEQIRSQVAALRTGDAIVWTLVALRAWLCVQGSTTCCRRRCLCVHRRSHSRWS